MPGDERRAHAGRGGQGGAVVPHAAPLERRVTALGGQQMGDARTGPEAGDIERAAVGLGALHAVAGDGRVHEPAMPGRHRRVVEAQTLESAEADVGDEHVGPRQQILHHGPPVVGGEVQGDAALCPGCPCRTPGWWACPRRE